MITKSRISDITGRSLEEIKQLGKKQMFLVDFDAYTVLYSYTTIIGVRMKFGAITTWRITDKSYSVTTSCHITAFPYYYTRITQPELEIILAYLETGVLLNRTVNQFT
jgi:hypothetical protein